MRLFCRHRPLFCPSYTLIHRCYSSTKTKTAEPLKILFCGSDHFSIASLHALHDAHLKLPQLIKSIDVVHKPGKRVGRGLKVIREVPIKQVAEDLKLNTHVINTFTGWTPPEPYNLIIAVSFGLFVPPRILSVARYGGLNVHPSLLPDLRGPAPIHHTLLKERKRTGITVQTLDPRHFDEGIILAQTPHPGLKVTAETPEELVNILAPLGGEMLVDVLKNRSFVPPYVDSGWYGKWENPGQMAHAGKLQRADHRIDWGNMSHQDVLLRNRVLGDLWTMVTAPDGSDVEGTTFIVHDLQNQKVDYRYMSDRKPGLKIVEGNISDVFAVTQNHRLMKISSCTIGGMKKGQGARQVVKWIQKAAGSRIHEFTLRLP